MRIGEASARSGVSAKMIRHYEGLGLLPRAPRRDNNYRDYDRSDVAILQFIRRARDLGFSLEEARELVALWRDRSQPSAKVKRLAESHIADLERRIAEMSAMADTLRGLARACRGDHRPECPILADLAGVASRRDAR
jgi:Cu(I)-responsive transcriptional regulator